MASAVRGVWNDGLTTTVHAAARAGATLRVIIAAGRFHGVIRSETPTGSDISRIRRPPPDGEGVRCPGSRTASSLYQRKKSAA